MAMPGASLPTIQSERTATQPAFSHSLKIEIDTIPDERWDDAVRLFDDSHHEQTVRFAVGRGHGCDSRLLLSNGDGPLAGARVAMMTLPALRSGLAFLRFGPFWRRRDRAADSDVYRAVVAALVGEYCVKRGHCLTVAPRPNPDFYPIEIEVLAAQGFAIRRKTADPKRYLVDLALDEDAQMRSLEQKWRYNLRQALGNKLEVRICESEADVQTFRALYATMVARKNFAAPEPDHLIGGHCAEGGPHCRLVLAFHDGKAVAGATVGIFGDTAYYMFGASAVEALALKAGYALQWWIVRWLSERGGVRWYDLGGEVGEEGLRQFKKGLVGKRGAIVMMNGEYDRWTHVTGRLTADVIYGLRAAQRAIRGWRP
jgi:hypothetical protein